MKNFYVYATILTLSLTIGFGSLYHKKPLKQHTSNIEISILSALNGEAIKKE